MQDLARAWLQAEVVQTLMKLFSCIYVRLSDLISVRQTRFELVVAVGLGVHGLALSDIKFLPLSDIKTTPVSQELRRLGGTAQPVQ